MNYLYINELDKNVLKKLDFSLVLNYTWITIPYQTAMRDFNHMSSMEDFGFEGEYLKDDDIL